MKNTTIFALISLAAVVILLSGCGAKTGTTAAGNGVVTSNVGEEGLKNWCQEGAEWKYTAEEGPENAEWTIKGLMTSGEYAGLCHVEYIVTSEQGTSKMDYYFNEDGTSGYFEMDVGGNKIKQEWHG